jgi:hypothetical protein
MGLWAVYARPGRSGNGTRIFCRSSAQAGHFLRLCLPRYISNVVQAPKPSWSSIDANLDAVSLGGLFTRSYFFNRFIGVPVEFGEHEWGNTRYPNPIGIGQIVRFPMKYIVPFVHLIAGGADFNHDVPGTTPVDENVVKPEMRNPLPQWHRSEKPQK